MLGGLFEGVKFYRDGGSIPALALFKEHLNLYMTCFSFGLPDDNIHSPNERYITCITASVASDNGNVIDDTSISTLALRVPQRWRHSHATVSFLFPLLIMHVCAGSECPYIQREGRLGSGCCKRLPTRLQKQALQLPIPHSRCRQSNEQHARTVMSCWARCCHCTQVCIWCK